MQIIENLEDFKCTDSVLSFGNFDGLHLGHDKIISTVKKIAKDLNACSALLTFNPHPSSFLLNKNDFLLLDLEQKIELIANYNLDYLHLVRFDHNFAKITADEFIKNVLHSICRVKHVVVGRNCVFGQGRNGNVAMLEQYSKVYNFGLSVVEPYLVDGKICSSTIIRDALQAGNLNDANKMIGRCYQISGSVIEGLKRGKTIGFPTINIKIDHILKPKFGVYHVRIKIDKIEYYGIANLGIRPTFNDSLTPLLEVHIFDFNRDIYGCAVKVELLRFVRPERKFVDTYQLRQQIDKDIKDVSNYEI